MKGFLIFCVIGAAYAGVGQLSPQEEAQALQLFNQICASGSEGTNLGDTLVYCKRARGDLSETLNHQVQVGGPGGAPSQVVFVQPPPVRYVHRVAITGQNGQGQQAKIYVLPQKATHELSAQYQGGATQAVKPVVYFLKGENNNGGGGGGAGGGGGGAPGGNNGGYQQPGGPGGNTGGGGGGGYQQPAPGGNAGGGYQQPAPGGGAGGGYQQPGRNPGGYS